MMSMFSYNYCVTLSIYDGNFSAYFCETILIQSQNSRICYEEPALYPFDGHSVIKRTEKSTSQKPGAIVIRRLERNKPA
jgi:hypothetical protein